MLHCTTTARITIAATANEIALHGTRQRSRKCSCEAERSVRVEPRHLWANSEGDIGGIGDPGGRMGSLGVQQPVARRRRRSLPAGRIRRPEAEGKCQNRGGCGPRFGPWRELHVYGHGVALRRTGRTSRSQSGRSRGDVGSLHGCRHHSQTAPSPDDGTRTLSRHCVQVCQRCVTHIVGCLLTPSLRRDSSDTQHFHSDASRCLACWQDDVVYPQPSCPA